MVRRTCHLRAAWSIMNGLCLHLVTTDDTNFRWCIVRTEKVLLQRVISIGLGHEHIATGLSTYDRSLLVFFWLTVCLASSRHVEDRPLAYNRSG